MPKLIVKLRIELEDAHQTATGLGSEDARRLAQVLIDTGRRLDRNRVNRFFGNKHEAYPRELVKRQLIFRP